MTSWLDWMRPAVSPKIECGMLLELDDDFRDAGGEALAGAQVEGNAGPAPVGDVGLDGDEGLGVALAAELVEIALHRAARGGTGPVLAAHRCLRGLGAADALQRAQHLQLLVAHRIGVHRGGRFHGDEAEQLQDVVLHHVAQRAGLVVIGHAVFEADGLRDGDLHVVDMGGVPQRLVERVGKAQRHQVLHRLLAEIVVDAEDLVLAEVFRRSGRSAPARTAGRGRSASRRRCASSAVTSPFSFSLCEMSPKMAGATAR